MKLLFFLLFVCAPVATLFAQNITEGNNLYPIRQNGKYGYINRDGDIAIAPIFDDADYFYEGLAAVKTKRKWGFIDSKNKIVIPAQYDSTLHFSEGWCAVATREPDMPIQWGYVNATNHTFAASKLASLGFATNFYDHRAMVSFQGYDEPFFIDHTGNQVLAPTNDYTFFSEPDVHFRDGMLKVMKMTGIGSFKYLFIDTTGKLLKINPDYPALGDFHEGMAWFMKDQKYGFIDKNGTEVIKAKYDTVLDFSEGWARVSQNMDYNGNTQRLENGVHSYINQLGETVLQPKARLCYSFHGGYARIYEQGKWGYMNTNGSVVIPATYDAAQDFFRGMARVEKDGKWYYMNTKGKTVWGESD